MTNMLIIIVVLGISGYFFVGLNRIHRQEHELVIMEIAKMELEYQAVLLDKKLIALEPPEMQEAITEEFRLWWILEQQFAHGYGIPIPFRRPSTENLILWGKLRYELHQRAKQGVIKV